MAIVKAAERREDRYADSLIDRVDALASRTQALLDEVFPEKRKEGQAVKPRDVAAVVREVGETLRLTAQLTGQLKGDSSTVNVGVGVGEPRRVEIVVRHVRVGVDGQEEILSEKTRDVPPDTVSPQTLLPRPESGNGTGQGGHGV